MQNPNGGTDGNSVNDHFTAPFTVSGTVGISSYSTNAGFNIFPNPATSSFTIEGISIAEKVYFSIYNIVGAEIKSGNIKGNGSSFQGIVPITDMSKGIYFLKVNDGDNSWIQKLIIQ